MDSTGKRTNVGATIKVIAFLCMMPVFYAKTPLWLMVVCFLPFFTWTLYRTIILFRQHNRQKGWQMIIVLLFITAIFIMLVISYHFPHLLPLDD